MNAPTVLLANFPAIARVAPFVVFVFLTSCQSWFGDEKSYWIYLAKTLVGAWMLWVVRGVVQEMRWKASWEAVVVGVVVFVLWVGLDRIVPTQQELWIKLGLSKAPATPTPAWNPFVQFGSGTALGWFFVAVRVLGSSLVVPPLEEVFYRSFLYRLIAGEVQSPKSSVQSPKSKVQSPKSKVHFKSKVQSPKSEVQGPSTLDLGLRTLDSVDSGLWTQWTLDSEFAWKPFLLTALIFGFAHNEWLAGILCAAAYQGLVCWKKRLGDAMTAHAITNFLLGVWVVGRGAWHFW